MTFDIEVSGRVRKVEVQRRDGLFAVSVDGLVQTVDARQTGPCTWSLLLSGAGAARAIDVAVAPQRATGEFDVHVAGRRIPALLRTGTRLGRRGAEGAGASGVGPQRIVAPMPGKIVRVLVKTGDQVKARQGVVVVEAMKMENELRSGRDGRVRQVVVAEGQSVEAGALLLLVE